MSWKPLWSYRTVDMGESLGNYEDLTLRLRTKVSTSGSRVRLLLENRYNEGPLVYRRMTVAREGSPETETLLTLAGHAGTTLQPGERCYTDALSFPLTRGDVLLITLEYASATGLRGLSETWSARTWQSTFNGGSCTGTVPYLAEDVHEPNAMFGLTQVDVFTESHCPTIALFGDSLTQMSYYYDALFDRMMAETDEDFCLVNAGIGGNRLCRHAAYDPEMGAHSARHEEAGYSRFEKDLYTTLSPDTVLFLQGTNDCWQGFAFEQDLPLPAAEDYIARCEAVIWTAHRHSSRIWVGTIPPANTFRTEPWFGSSDRLRQSINTWLLSQRAADGVFDFAACLRDPNDPSVLPEDLHLGDGLHPNTAGGKIMAELIPLEELV